MEAGETMKISKNPDVWTNARGKETNVEDVKFHVSSVTSTWEDGGFYAILTALPPIEVLEEKWVKNG